MAAITTLGAKTVKDITVEESYLIAIKRTADDADMRRGRIVTLDSDGEVSLVSAATEYPLGMVVSGGEAVGDTVTIATPFYAIIRAKASGAVAIGDRLACNGQDSGTDKLSTFIVAVATNYVSAVALTAGADEAEITVGLLRTPVLF